MTKGCGTALPTAREMEKVDPGILGPSNRNLKHEKQHFKSPLCVIKIGNPGLNGLHLVGAKGEKEAIRKGGGEEERKEREGKEIVPIYCHIFWKLCNFFPIQKFN